MRFLRGADDSLKNLQIIAGSREERKKRGAEKSTKAVERRRPAHRADTRCLNQEQPILNHKGLG